MSKKKNGPHKENEAPENVTSPAEVSDTPSQTAEEAPPAEISEVETLKIALAGEKDKYLRLAAEYDNFRKRSQKEREALYTDVRVDTIFKLLPVYDNLERALATPTDDEAYKRGVEMIMTQLCSIFEKMGVTPIEAVGKPFDPTLHNAIMHVEDETKGENEIVEEFEKGFMLGDKVIRFSMVKVAN